MTDSPAVIFSQRIVPGLGLRSLFSVQSNSVVELRGRAIVTQEGSDLNSSLWKCSKDTGTDSCYHIKQAKALLPEDFGTAVADATALGGGIALIKGTNVGTEREWLYPSTSLSTSSTVVLSAWTRSDHIPPSYSPTPLG